MTHTTKINGIEVKAVKGKGQWGFVCAQSNGICWGAGSMKKAFADAEKFLKAIKAI